VAAALGVSVGTVKSQASRALQKLRTDTEFGRSQHGEMPPAPVSIEGK
jgi:DNA-directed RNA polymerase specialized sigma24 family protein